jgi:hypothetical protein
MSGPVDGSSRRSPSSHSSTTYSDPSSVTQAMNTPPYGENYGYGSGGLPAQPAQPDDPRRQNGARSHARHGGTGEGTRAAPQAYPQDSYQGTGSYPADGYQGNGNHQSTGSHQGNGNHQAGGYPTGGYPTGGYPDAGHQGNGHQSGAYPGGAHRGNGHRAPYDPRDDYRRLTPPGLTDHPRLASTLGSCPRETSSGTPPAACTRRWPGGR